MLQTVKPTIGIALHPGHRVEDTRYIFQLALVFLLIQRQGAQNLLVCCLIFDYCVKPVLYIAESIFHIAKPILHVAKPVLYVAELILHVAKPAIHLYQRFVGPVLFA